MFSIRKAIQDIILNNTILTFGMAHKLLNITQTAKWIKPVVEARTKKEVSDIAVIMSLNRLAKNYEKLVPDMKDMKLDRISILSELCALTYLREQSSPEKISALFQSLLAQGHNTVSLGVNEITLICKDNLKNEVQCIMNTTPLFEKRDLAAIIIQFDRKYVEDVGFVYGIIQLLTLQHINIWEFSSTYTELILYVEETDARLTFDTLYQRFM